MISTDFLDALARFNLIVRKRVTSNFSGPRKSRAQGRGLIYKDYRQYSPGDDFRAVDWKVFARTDDLVIKNYEEEKNLIVHILVDSSHSMSFGKKFDYATMIGVGHAYLALKGNDKVQFATFGEDLDIYQSRRGISQVMSMIDYLNKVKPKGKTDLAGIARKYRKMIGSRAMVIIISDFLSSLDSIKEMLACFSQDEVSLVHILDEKEKNFFAEGDLRLSDSESQDRMRTFFSLKSRQEYTERLENHIAQVQHECLTRGVDFSSICTETPIFEAFYSVFTKR